MASESSDNTSCVTSAAESACCVISDLSPSWDEETIALLLNMSLQQSDTDDRSTAVPVGSIRVELVTECGCKKRKSSSSSGTVNEAKLTFSSKNEMAKVIDAYRGIAVPMTHGYHYYTFGGLDCGENIEAEDASNGNGVDDAANISHSGSPPLHLQLIALTTKELERRLKKIQISGSSINSGNTNTEKVQKGKGNKRCRVHKHAALSSNLSRALGNARPIQHCLGVPAPDGSTDTLLQYLRTCTLWPPQTKQRRGVSAGNYLTVRKQHPPEHDKIWDLCRDLINTTIVPNAVYNALAITKSFRGSPHIDHHDKTFQHVIALGDFTGGMLCAEADEDGAQTLAINVCNRFGRIDGRSVHWVSEWSGERYSIVYYSTAKEDFTERVPQEVHTKWMESAATVCNKSEHSR